MAPLYVLSSFSSAMYSPELSLTRFLQAQSEGGQHGDRDERLCSHEMDELDAVDERESAIRIPLADVARAEPAIDEGLGVLLIASVVASRD